MARTTRRRLIGSVAALGGAAAVGAFAFARSSGGRSAMGDIGMGGSGALGPELASIERGNFAAIYGDPALRERFLSFLTNVFHLYPEDRMHALISSAVSALKDDRMVYERIERELPEIAPALGAFRYALPALRKQQSVMAEQTVQLLEGKKRFEGYLEIGSDGRYLSALEDKLEIERPIFTSSPKAPGYGPDEILDRGQLGLVGTHVPMNGYAPFSAKQLPSKSLSLVTIYVGLHHVPLALREPYVASIRDAMAKDSTLILRDHDVTSPQLRHLVALAHDVFNVGTEQPWSVNSQELRNFYPLDFIVGFLEQHGFKAKPARLLQDGDPTLNTLLAFAKG
jgi:hypothetical protein